MVDNHQTKGDLTVQGVTLIGVPYDASSSFMRGPAEAPTRIREVFHSGATNLCAENGLELGSESRFHDGGDLSLGDDTSVVEQIEAEIGRVLDKDSAVLALGGDHSVTYPIVKAHAKMFGALNILHFDAHSDLYDEFEGNRFSHACPFARIMEENLASRLVQIGIRTMNPHQRSQADRFGVEVIEARDWINGSKAGRASLNFDGPVYISLDLDVLDPAFAPGVSHHEPGGLSSRDVLEAIQTVTAPIVGADIVELNPRRDPVGITASAAVKFLVEIAAQMLRNP